MNLATPESQASKLLLSINETCRVLSLGRTSIYREISCGRLIAPKAAGRTLVHLIDLQAYAEARRAESTQH
jgi:predicted DNA-binding transcriptional regulator AlpA